MSVATIISNGIGIVDNGVSIYKSNQEIDHENKRFRLQMIQLSGLSSDNFSEEEKNQMINLRDEYLSKGDKMSNEELYKVAEINSLLNNDNLNTNEIKDQLNYAVDNVQKIQSQQISLKNDFENFAQKTDKHLSIIDNRLDLHDREIRQL